MTGVQTCALPILTKLQKVRVNVPIYPNDGEVLTYSAFLNTFSLKTPTFKVISKTANYIATVDNLVILVDATAGNVNITIPTARNNNGKLFVVKKIDSTANTVTITPYGTQLIDGSSTVVISVQYTAVMIVSDNFNWWIL